MGSTTLVRSAGWRDARGPSQRLTDDRQTLLFFLARGTPSFREAECACKPVKDSPLKKILLLTELDEVELTLKRNNI